MYCSKCGNKLIESDKYCANCGNKIDNINNSFAVPSTNGDNGRTASIVLGILSLIGVFMFIFSPISLILSIIGLVLAIRSNKISNNTVGIVMNGISLFLSFMLTLFIGLIIYFLVTGSDYIEDWYWNNDYEETHQENF